MDTLSTVLRATRMRSPLIADLGLGNNLSIGLPALGGLPFHYVLSGSCKLVTPNQSVGLKAGDLVMLAHIPYYRFETGSGSQRTEVMQFAERDNFLAEDLRTGRNHLLKRKFGKLPVKTRLFSAIVYTGDYGENPLFRDLPRITLLRRMTVNAQLESWVVAAIEFISRDVRSSSEPGLSVLLERLIEVVIIALLRKWMMEADHPPGWMRGLTDVTVRRALDAMHAAPGRRWTLDDIAVAAGRSRSGFAKHFRVVMDETPFGYLTRWRMHLACGELALGQHSIGDIALRLGYGSSLAFRRSFAATVGESPAYYRKRCRSDARKAAL